MSEERSFIEVQFPVSKVSKESYKERMAGSGQILTGIGKWWGRKPLVLVRSALLGLLLPATGDSVTDRSVFYKLMQLDDAALKRRRNKNFTVNEIYEKLSTDEKKFWFENSSSDNKIQLKKITLAEKEELQNTVFARLSYDEKLNYCERIDLINELPVEIWQEINGLLGTSAETYASFVKEIGMPRFGRIPIAGDVFCGGGSIPFEAARMGFTTVGSDLNPVAAFLSWAAINIVGGEPAVAIEIRKFQDELISSVEQQIAEWEIEHDEKGRRAEVFLYCSEVTCPDCGWRIPLAPSWVVSEKYQTAAVLTANETEKRFDVSIVSNLSAAQLKDAKKSGTFQDSKLVCPNEKCPAHITPVSLNRLRGDRRSNGETEYGLRLWKNSDVVPRQDDVFGEKLYCIRWVDTVKENGKTKTIRSYETPNAADLVREEKVVALLQERLAVWQKKGYIPGRRIEPGDKTDEPIRTRGWTHWHHLFNPRDLLRNGLIASFIQPLADKNTTFVQQKKAAGLLLLGKIANYSGKTTIWNSISGHEGIMPTSTTQALNTLANWGCRGLAMCNSLLLAPASIPVTGSSFIVTGDASAVQREADFWVTDPPYADAVNYHELSEFYLAWYDQQLLSIFPEWYNDSKRAFAVTGASEQFKLKMVECYKNMKNHMSDNGAQVVMFTHQNAAVWADLALILWSAGLRVTAAWCVATETDSAMKVGNYVQGTVLLVLRKQASEATAFLDEIYPQVDEEVKNQLAEMTNLDDKEDPNFSDTDYQLAAYGAALRVLTSYRRIEEIDVQRELVKVRAKGEVSPLEEVIREAVKIACNYQIPTGLDKEVWRGLSADERFYIKGLELESHGEYRTGAYQEFAKGFGIKEYSLMLSSGKANQTRLKTASEFAGRNLGGEGFASTLTRHALYAVRETAASGETVNGRNWFRNELGARYWAERKNLVGILNYFANFAHSANMPQWQKDASAAKLLAVAVENDHV